MKILRSPLLLLCVFSSPLFSQLPLQRSSLHSAFRDSNTVVTRFERNVNTYLWNGVLRYSVADSGFLFSLSDYFTSSLIRRQFRSFRDEQNFSFTAVKKLSANVFVATEGQSFFLSDNQTLGASNAGIHSGVVGIQYRPRENITLTPLVGMRYDKQGVQRDDGMNYRLYALVDAIEVSNYRTSLNGHLNYADLGSRLFKNNVATLDITTVFAPGSADSLRIRRIANRNDFYIPADSSVIRGFGVASNIRSRTEELWGISNALDYHIGSGIEMQFTVDIESRVVDNAFRYKNLSDINSILFNTSVQELLLSGRLSLRYVSSSTVTTIGMVLGERDERHQLQRINGVDNLVQDIRARQESKLDNTAVRSTLYADVVSEVSTTDRLSFSGSFGVLQYDTPDSLNTDDRDELLMNFTLREHHRFSHVLSATMTAEATLAHTVYLKRDKSANNNWNRIFRLSPEVRFTPSPSLTMVNSFEVLANYTVFDFESLIPSVKSYSYRQVAFLDSTSYDITQRVGVDLFAYIRIFERGELRWKEFVERPLQRFEEFTFSPQFRYTYGDRWMFAAGFRSFAQKRFRYLNNTRQFESTLLSAGPTARVQLTLSQQSFIDIHGWKEFQRLTGGSIQEFSNVMMTVRYTI